VSRAVRRGGLAALVLAALLVAGTAAFLGLVPGVKGRYRNGDPALASAFRAKEACSCLFVAGLDEAACRAWTVASPEAVVYRILDSRSQEAARQALDGNNVGSECHNLTFVAIQL